MFGLQPRRAAAAVLVLWAVSEPLLLETLHPWRALVAGLLVALPGLLLGRIPTLAAALTVTAFAGQLILEALPARSVVGGLCIVAALYAAAVDGSPGRRLPIGALCVGAGFLLAAQVLAALDLGIWAFVGATTQMYLAGLVLSGLAVGMALRDRSGTLRRLQVQVTATETRLATASTDAARAERTAIAEQLGTIVRDVEDRLPDATGERPDAAALHRAQRAAQDALGQIRRLLTVLREPAPAAPPATTAGPALHRRLGLAAPWLLFAALGTLEQLLLPERPYAIAPDVVVGTPAYGPAVILVLCWLTPLPLLLRRRAPLAAVALIGIMLAGRTLADDLSSLTWTQHFLGLGTAFVAGAYCATRTRALVGLALAATTCVTCWVLEELTMTPAEWAYLAALLLAAWTTGRALAGTVARAETTRQAVADLDARLRAVTDEVVELERGRAAREVHDLVGHGLSLVSIQAAVTARRLDRGEDVGGALHTVCELAETTRRELVELQAVLAGAEVSVTRPEAATALDELARTSRRHGHEVDLQAPTGPLPPLVVDVVREALSNVRKHAGPVPTQVSVVRSANGVEVRVSDPGGAGTDAPGTRLGLTGMAERVAAAGGHLEAGPRPGGGWEVRTVLPHSVAMAS